jgi:hypothetical protein
MEDGLCNKRFHPKGGGADPEFYWYFCREPEGHAGDCDCPAVHEQLLRPSEIVDD